MGRLRPSFDPLNALSTIPSGATAIDCCHDSGRVVLVTAGCLLLWTPRTCSLWTQCTSRHPYAAMPADSRPLLVDSASGYPAAARRRPDVDRRDVLVVGGDSRVPGAGAGCRRPQTIAVDEPCDVRRAHARTGDRAGGEVGGDHTGAASACVLLRFRVGGGRGRREDGLAVLGLGRASGKAQTDHLAWWVSRRHRAPDECVRSRRWHACVVARHVAAAGVPRAAAGGLRRSGRRALSATCGIASWQRTRTNWPRSSSSRSCKAPEE